MKLFELFALANLIREAHEKKRAVIYNGFRYYDTNQPQEGEEIVVDYRPEADIWDKAFKELGVEPVPSILTDNDIAIAIGSHLRRNNMQVEIG